MKMATPALNSLELSLKVWDCAGIKSHDQRSRVLKKIDQQCEGYWVERRDGRTAVLHKGKTQMKLSRDSFAQLFLMVRGPNAEGPGPRGWRYAFGCPSTICQSNP